MPYIIVLWPSSLHDYVIVRASRLA